MKNAINWFEIPAADLDRATKFYNTIFEVELIPIPDAEGMHMFPVEEHSGISGAVFTSDTTEPSDKGTMVYLNGGDDLSTVLARVEGAGGTVLMPKTDISPNGFIARFKDTEGNHVGLHSMG